MYNRLIKFSYLNRFFMKKYAMTVLLSILSFSSFAEVESKPLSLAHFIESGHFYTDNENVDFDYSMWCIGSDVFISFRKSLSKKEDDYYKSMMFITSGSGNSISLPSINCNQAKNLKNQHESVLKYFQRFY